MTRPDRRQVPPHQRAVTRNKVAHPSAIFRNLPPTPPPNTPLALQVRFCPTADCGNAYVCDEGLAACPEIQCEGCQQSFCFRCRGPAHGSDPCPTSPAGGEDVKPCPKCAAPIFKVQDGRCNAIHCSLCGYGRGDGARDADHQL